MASHQWPASRPCKSLRRGRPRSKVWLILDDDGQFFFPNFTWCLRNFSDTLHFLKFILPFKSDTCFFWCNSNGIPHVVRYFSDIRNMFDIPNISKHAELDISRHSGHDLRLLELRILKAKSTGMRDER